MRGTRAEQAATPRASVIPRSRRSVPQEQA
jgi:hypothetical protein